MKILKSGVTAPKGFLASGAHVGLKKAKKDLAILYSKEPAIYAGTFTTNVVKAACVKWNQARLAQNNPIHGIVINSGNANACTGAVGILDNEAIAKKTGDVLACDAHNILVASTGVIGLPLNMPIYLDGIASVARHLGDTPQDGHLAAQGIMTTDTFSKEIAVEVVIDGKTVTIGGMAKGSGMIHPNMATMLSFITTDAAVDQACLQKIVATSVSDTYNMISVDGDTSTNDMVMVLANGLSGATITEEHTQGYQTFMDALQYVNTYLAQQIIHDGEGVTKVIEVQLSGAKDQQDAKLMAKSIITSNLFKTAMFGSDANWGRVLCAMGYSGAQFDHEKVSMAYESEKGHLWVLKSGAPVAFDEAYAKVVLSEREIKVLITLDEGDGKATAWGCDLSYEYVRINGEYRS